MACAQLIEVAALLEPLKLTVTIGPATKHLGLIGAGERPVPSQFLISGVFREDDRIAALPRVRINGLATISSAIDIEATPLQALRQVVDRGPGIEGGGIERLVAQQPGQLHELPGGSVAGSAARRYAEAYGARPERR